ncbi:MAG: flagellar biosynthesis protein FlhF [Firmicutes bacterium]|jgi:flagellar biosynthesis protein FlhF|nr:flagellar biosynthesis protein FlhF [Bacillota bacterium]MDH7495381.1 flagellar biosynthesis protein FlhF [Bacillota bacterium]
MRIKRYVARTIQEALDTVREDLGPDAVILHTRKARRGKIAGLLGGERFEVIAALDVNVPEAGRSAGMGRTTIGTRGVVGTHAGATPASGQTPEGSPSSGRVVAGRTVGSANKRNSARSDGGAVRRASPREVTEREGNDFPEWPRPVATAAAGRAYESTPAARLVEIHERLLDMDLDPDLAQALVQAAKMKWREAQVAGKSAYELVLDLITAMLPVAGGVALTPGSRRVVALVGPTGVGKTTTLAKVAALTALFGKKKVAFITADTYRIAAVEQLRTYAEIIRVPCEVVYTPSEMRQALASHDGCDLVLIDTAGRNPRSSMHMAELRAFLEAAQVDETHLVLSMTTRPRDLLETVERFSPCGVNRLIFSKLDETLRLGPILGVTSAVKLPISYVTYGQNVPEDIEVADAAQLARWILDGGVGDIEGSARSDTRNGGAGTRAGAEDVAGAGVAGVETDSSRDRFKGMGGK